MRLEGGERRASHKPSNRKWQRALALGADTKRFSWFWFKKIFSLSYALSNQLRICDQKRELRRRCPWIRSCWSTAQTLLVCPLGSPPCQRDACDTPPYCARSSLVRGYPCVCPLGALTYLLRKNILLIGLVGAFHALFTAPTGLKHGYPRSSDDRSADRG